MQELIWLNGEILPMAEARLGVEDRGFQFADGVYEVIRLYDGRPFTLREHLERLERSAEGISLAVPLGRPKLTAEIERFLDRAQPGEGMIYLQLTRGAAPRNHVFPEDVQPTLLFYARPLPRLAEPGEGPGVKLISVNDERWKRCWIKSIALLPNVLAKNQAVQAGADEAVFVDDGVVTECSASNFFLVSNETLITHPVGPRVLPGITRAVLLEVAKEIGVDVRERPFRIEEARQADEAFVSSTTREISWAREWDGNLIGDGRCGAVTLALHRGLRRRVLTELASVAGPCPNSIN
jgi:D-alanine transaminase